jgi:predicted outer membrane protein
MWQTGSGLRLSVFALVASVAVAACEPREDISTIDTAIGDIGSALGIGGDEMSQPAALGTLAAVHSAEVQSGELAQQRATNAQVRQLAQRVAQEHAAFLQRLRGMNLNIDTTAADAELVQMADSSMRRLRSIQGAAFDTAWVNAQVMMHEEALERAQRIADQDFSDTTGRAGDTAQAGSSQMLDEYLDNTAELIEQHLDAARQLQERLREGNAGA